MATIAITWLLTFLETKKDRVMNYEQILKEALDNKSTPFEVASWIEEQFPELKESEDEKIRKGLIEYFLHYPDHEITYYGLKADSVVSWLEKQGEQKPADKVEPKFRVGDTMRTLEEANSGITDGMPVVVSIDDKYYRCNNELIAIKDQDDYEYPPMNRKQKPAEWSEEDSLMIDETLFYIDEFQKSDRCKNENDMQNSVTCEKWLKSLKDRVQPQPK